MFYFSDRFTPSEGGRGERQAWETGKGQIKEHPWDLLGGMCLSSGLGAPAEKLEVGGDRSRFACSIPSPKTFPCVVLFLARQKLHSAFRGMVTVPYLKYFSFIFPPEISDIV